jgi:hypothetical protein
VNVSLLDLNSGNLIAGPYEAFNPLEALAVAGEPRAALVAAPASAPALSGVALIALAISVAVAAMRRPG